MYVMLCLGSEGLLDSDILVNQHWRRPNLSKSQIVQGWQPDILIVCTLGFQNQFKKKLYTDENRFSPKSSSLCCATANTFILGFHINPCWTLAYFRRRISNEISSWPK